MTLATISVSLIGAYHHDFELASRREHAGSASVLKETRLCGIPRAVLDGTGGHPNVEQNEPNSAHQPRLPHAPRKGCDGDENCEGRRCEGLGFKWQKRDAEHNSGTGERHQDYARHAELVPGLEK